MELTKRTLLAGTTGLVTLATLGNVAFAQGSSSSSPSAAFDGAACADALDKQNSGMDGAIDALAAAQKKALQARTDALKSAAKLTEIGARKAAVRAAEDLFRDAMNEATAAYHAAIEPGNSALRDDCAGFGNDMANLLAGPVAMKVLKTDKKVFQPKAINAKEVTGMMRKLREQRAAQMKKKSSRSSSASSVSSANSSSSSTAQ